MPATRPNPLKLNKLQLRTLVLLQELARLPDVGQEDPEGILIAQLPHAHGDHVHIGPYVVSTREISGFSNPAVWTALTRRGLIVGEFPGRLVLTPAGRDYVTGLSDRFTQPSDH